MRDHRIRIAAHQESLTMRLISIALLGGLLLCPAAVLAAEATWENELLARLEERRGQEEAEEGALVSIWEARIDVLGEDESLRFEFEEPELVREGTADQEFVVLAVCDDDCADVDLYIWNQKGGEVGSDIEVGPLPVIVTPDLETGYSIEVYMAECAVAPCYFAVGIFFGSAAEEESAAVD